MFNGDGSKDLSSVEHRHGLILVEGHVHQAGCLVEPIRAVEHHADDPHAVSFRAEDQAAPGLLGIAGLDASRTIVCAEEFVLVVQHPVIASPLPGNGGTGRRDDLPEFSVLHGFPGDERQVVRGGVVSFAGESVRCEEHGVFAAKLSSARGHQPAELLDGAADVLCDGGGRIIAGGQHQAVEHLPQRESLTLCQVDARPRDTKGVAAAGDRGVQIAQLQGQERRHHLGGGGHG